MMGHYVEGIADNLSREFRSMTSGRTSRWWCSSRGLEEGSPRGFSLDDGYGAYTRPLRYGSGGGLHHNHSRRMADESAGEYGAPISRWDSISTRRRSKAEPVSEGRAQFASEDSWRRGVALHDRQSRSRKQGWGWRGGDRRLEALSSPTSSYASSFTSSHSSRNFDSASTPSETRSSCESSAYRVSHERAQSQRKSSGRMTNGSLRSSLGWTPAGHHPDAKKISEIRWVDDGTRGRESEGAPHNFNTSSPLPGYVNLYEEDVGVNPTMQPPSIMSTQMPSLQPSRFLQRVIESIAYYRGIPPPPSVPREVILAFDEYVAPGSIMLKFIPHGPPHFRFFMIRFLNIFSGTNLFRSGQEHHHHPTGLYAVLSWYRKASSHRMIRFLPLHNLIQVKADGEGHKYVRRRVLQPGILRGPCSGLLSNHVSAERILQFRFSSHLLRVEETLALRAVSHTQYSAWLVVASFISQIGSVY